MRKKTYREEYRMIGGVRQYLLHYPAAEDAPVLLFLHGGPGQPESDFGYLFRRWWGDLFTVVFWDQRACGKTLAANLRPPRYPVTVEALQSDLHEIVEFLKASYGRQKIVIMGHSWGTVLGSLYALEHPENVLLYIGVGQVINLQENEKIGVAKLEQCIAEAGNLKDKKKLAAIGEYRLDLTDKVMRQKIIRVRRLQTKYGLMKGITAKLVRQFITSPVFRLSDFSMLSTKVNLYQSEPASFLVKYDLRDYGAAYNVPVCCLLGGNDYQAAAPLAVSWFESITAPQKLLRILPGAGHNTMYDTPQLFTEALTEARGMI